MRTLLHLLSTAILISLCWPSLGGESKVENEILQLVRDYERSVNQANSNLWLSIWDLEYPELTILENDKAQTLGRKYVEQIAESMKGVRPKKRQTWHTNRVILLRPDLAYILSLRTEHNMPKDKRESRISLLARQEASGWKIIHAHFSFIPNERRKDSESGLTKADFGVYRFGGGA